MSLAENLHRIKNSLPPQVSLVAISKTKPVHDIREVFEAGQTDFGENKVQEMTSKQAELPAQIQWHQVGHLQSNKVKYLAPYVHLIHSIDSLKLLEEVNRQALKNNRIIGVLLQMHIAREESKFGMDEQELRILLENAETMGGIQIRGLMGMATNSDNELLVASEFSGLRKLFDQYRQEFQYHPRCDWQHLSMGMSGDYPIAIEEGSTMIRVGSAIFGHR